jgi:hypothetical protein
MFDTNLILGITFTIISNFNAAVNVPVMDNITNVNQLSRAVVGSPGRPTDVFIIDRESNRFDIVGGAVIRFTSRESLFHRTNQRPLAQYAGLVMLDSNKLIYYGDNNLNRLVKNGHSLSLNQPVIRQSSDVYGGAKLPFFELTWFGGNDPKNSLLDASMEIDARTGNIVDLRLYNSCFFDFSMDQKIKNIATPLNALSVNEPLTRIVGDRPDHQSVAKAIKLWLTFCKGLSLNNDNNSSDDQIDWQQTALIKDRSIAPSNLVTRITFISGAHFGYYDDAIYSYTRSNACFVGNFTHRSREDWKRFEGTAQYDWNDLAKRLETNVATFLGLSGGSIPDSIKTVQIQGANVGSVGMIRTIIKWRKWRKIDRPVFEEELAPIFSAEFDLETGEIKGIYFQDYDTIQNIAKTLKILEK